MEDTTEFSQQQLEYLHDTSFLLSKRTISKQLQLLFATTERTLAQFINQKKPASIPEKCLKAAGKISRGENYRGLPYIVLDYPRLFKKEDIFTFRSMFWWGNFFSCTLHLEGESLQRFRPHLQTFLLSHKNSWHETYLCVNNTPWEYHYGEENYQLLSNMDEDRIIRTLEKNFVKISRHIKLHHYQNLPEFALQSFSSFLAVLQPQ